MLLLKMLNQPVQILKAGQNNAYLSDLARRNLRLPGGHREGYIEAFANMYRNVAYDISGRQGHDIPNHHLLEYPGILDGVRGCALSKK